MTWNEILPKLRSAYTIDPFDEETQIRRGPDKRYIPVAKGYVAGGCVALIFLDRNDEFSYWDWSTSRRLDAEAGPAHLKEAPLIWKEYRWMLDAWNLHAPPFSVAEWYRENGYPLD